MFHPEIKENSNFAHLFIYEIKLIIANSLRTFLNKFYLKNIVLKV